MGELEETHSGCLVASFAYENQQFNNEIRDLIKSGLQSWRDMIIDRLIVISEKYPIKSDVSFDVLADMFISAIEGGVMLVARIWGQSFIGWPNFGLSVNSMYFVWSTLNWYHQIRIKY